MEAVTEQNLLTDPIQIERLPEGLRKQFLLAIPVPQLLSLIQLSEVIKGDLEKEAFWIEKLKVLRYKLPDDFGTWLNAVSLKPEQRLELMIELAKFDNSTLERIHSSLMNLSDLSSDIEEEKVPEFLCDILNEIETIKRQLNEKISATRRLLDITRQLVYQLKVLYGENSPVRKNVFNTPPLPAIVDFNGGTYQEMVSAIFKVYPKSWWASIYLPFLEEFLQEGDIFNIITDNGTYFYLHIGDKGKVLQHCPNQGTKHYLPSSAIPLLKKLGIKTFSDLSEHFDKRIFVGFMYQDQPILLTDYGKDIEIEGHIFTVVQKEAISKSKTVPKETREKSFRSATGNLFD